MTILGDLRATLRLAPRSRWSTPAMIILGFASALAETFGVSLIVLFLYSAMGQAEATYTMGGWLGPLLARVSTSLPSGISVAAVIFALILVRGLIAYAYNVISGSIGARISEQARNSIHAQYLDVSYDSIRRFEQGLLLDLLATQSWAVAAAYTSLTRVAINACSLVVFVLFLFALSWRIALAALVGSLLISLISRSLRSAAHELGAEAKRANQTLAECILITLQGMRTVRAYGQENAQRERFLQSSAAARSAALKLERRFALLTPATEIGYLVVLIFIVVRADLLQASFSTTLAAVALLYRLQPHLRELEANLLSLAQLGPSVRAVLAMVSRDDKLYPPVGTHSYEKLAKEVRFEQVSLRYGDTDGAALDDVSFQIPAGKITALVGASGAGKTTIVSLLLRLYQPKAGRILVDGVPLDDIRRDEWLGHLAVAGQDIDLIEGTIADNIRMARSDADANAVAEAAHVAGLSEVIAGLSEGYETWIGQQGMNLSGGQRQRVGLARATLRDADLLILDEAMSALDRELEDDIRVALRARFRNRTIVLITHRLETILTADHVVCLEDGRVVQEGERAVLMQHEGPLRRLFEHSESTVATAEPKTELKP